MEERRVAEGKEWRTAVEKSGGKRETTAKTEKVNDKGLDKMKRDRRNISKRDRQIDRERVGGETFEATFEIEWKRETKRV